MLAKEHHVSSTAWPNADTAARVGAVLFVAALTAAAGRFAVPLPFTPVPITLQPVIVLAGAVLLGARLGMASQLAFLTAGLLGAPVFAESTALPQGPLRFLGPTAGYLLSFPFAALVTGALASQPGGRGVLRAFTAMACGLAVMYVIGTSWLAGILMMTSGAGTVDAVSVALSRGLYPFVLLDLVKIAVASRVLPSGPKQT